MISMTPDAILSFMKKNKYEADIQQDTQQVYTILKINQREYPLFLRIYDEGHLLQLLVFIPSHLEPNDEFSTENPSSQEDHGRQVAILSDLARLLHLLNKELDLPGFGMDEMAGVVFYRLMLPTPLKKMDGEVLLAFLKSLEHVCNMFSTPIQVLSSGKMTLHEIISKTREKEKS